jgi:acyl-CoA thioesterase
VSTATGPDALSEHGEAEAPVDPFRDFLGAIVTRNGDGTVTARLDVRPEHLNPHGTVHGVVLYAVAGVAIAALANDGVHSGVVSAVHLDYLRPAQAGDLLAAVAEVDVRTEREDVIGVRVRRLPDAVLSAEPPLDGDASDPSGDIDAGELVLRASARATRRRRTSAS